LTAKQNRIVKACVGIHPWDADLNLMNSA